jgi:putative DNA primase/helicase
MSAANLKAVSEAFRTKSPTREIVLAADDDCSTPGNPGVTKAQEAAHAIRGAVAIPKFKAKPERGGDFNDLALAEGLDVVRDQITNAEPFGESDAQTFDRLARLSAADFDRRRQEEANKLGIRVATLDSEVEKRRPKEQGSDPFGKRIEFVPLTVERPGRWGGTSWRDLRHDPTACRHWRSRGAGGEPVRNSHVRVFTR